MGQEIIINELYKAFNINPNRKKQYDSKACLEFREHIISLYPKDAAEVLPYVLIDILENPSDEFSIGLFVDFLDGSNSDDEFAVVQDDKIKVFSLLDRHQAQAIHKSLLWINDNISRGISRCSIKKALTYWEQKRHGT